MRIKSIKTGLEQNVSEKTFKEMEALKPGLHKKIADEVPTPPEFSQNIPANEKNKGKTILPAGATASPDTTPTV